MAEFLLHKKNRSANDEKCGLFPALPAFFVGAPATTTITRAIGLEIQTTTSAPYGVINILFLRLKTDALQ